MNPLMFTTTYVSGRSFAESATEAQCVLQMDPENGKNENAGYKAASQAESGLIS